MALYVFVDELVPAKQLWLVLSQLHGEVVTVTLYVSAPGTCDHLSVGTVTVWVDEFNVGLIVDG